ncbi:MAG: hypothetical protein IPL55_13300 [Saprospiraceae bacterium]|nr:hypothetical protein [Saprospiraceae bacterium]MBL0024368.1 hypothetical protein [Saprospiraceae bacterium]
MDFFIKLSYYCGLFGTGVLSIFYIYTALFKRTISENPYYIKECFGLSSIFVLMILFRAYQVGEIQGKFINGIWLILSSWLVWGVVVLGYVILAKSQGRI